MDTGRSTDSGMESRRVAGLMPIERLDDWERRLERQDAFWQCRVTDRPAASITVSGEASDCPPPPAKGWNTLRDRWWDTEHVVAKALYETGRRRYFADSLPHFMPNLGPEVFSAFFGAELHYGESTAWSEPNLLKWEDADSVEFSWDSPYLKKIDELTDALLDAGRGRFYTGITDLHPGGDAIAAFRDPARLAIDMIECPEEITAMLEYVTGVFFDVYDHFAGRLLDAGQALSTWAGIVSGKRWYVPSNDFSCMISSEMFRRVFLPGIAGECAHLDASIYHLDGPGALQHLDSLLELDDLNAIQWVYGAGNGPASRWMDVYRRCRQAGKGVQIMQVSPGELDLFMSELKPEGVWLDFKDVKDAGSAGAIVKKLYKWT